MDTKRLYQAKDMAVAALQLSGVELRQSYGKIAHKTKSHAADIVTELDGRTEEFLAQQFARFDSSIGSRGEEFGTKVAGDTTWLVDPIDGTAHFVRGLPFCTSMVALIEDGQVVLALIHDFTRGDMYWAIRGEGAYRNDEKLQVSRRPLSNSLISFESNVALNGNIELLDHLRQHTVCANHELRLRIRDGRIGQV